MILEDFHSLVFLIMMNYLIDEDKENPVLVTSSSPSPAKNTSQPEVRFIDDDLYGLPCGVWSLKALA